MHKLIGSDSGPAAALKEMKKLDTIGGEPVCIRIVDIPEDYD